MILARLREQTRPHHDRLETRLDVMSFTRSLDRYRSLLERFYGFYRPVEDVLVPLAVQTGLEIDYAARCKSHRLLRDLRALDADAPADVLPLCTDLPTLTTAEQALGCMYVLEGATLGGQIIARHLHEAHGLTEQTGAGFFQSYGSEAGRMWKNFGAQLTEFSARREGDSDAAIIAAACDTFTRFEQWVCDENSGAGGGPAE